MEKIASSPQGHTRQASMHTRTHTHHFESPVNQTCIVLADEKKLEYMQIICSTQRDHYEVAMLTTTTLLSLIVSHQLWPFLESRDTEVRLIHLQAFFFIIKKLS